MGKDGIPTTLSRSPVLGSDYLRQNSVSIQQSWNNTWCKTKGSTELAPRAHRLYCRVSGISFGIQFCTVVKFVAVSVSDEYSAFQIRSSWAQFLRFSIFVRVNFSVTCVLSIPLNIPTPPASTIISSHFVNIAASAGAFASCRDLVYPQENTGALQG
jgi:hypothetical protein